MGTGREGEGVVGEETASGREPASAEPLATGPGSEGREETRDRVGRFARLGMLLPMLLAALGLAGALVAWRVGVASDEAQDATIEGLAAARARSAAALVTEGYVARTNEAWLDYERARRRAAGLQTGGLPGEALNETKVAATHWFLVRPEYVDTGGEYQPDRHRAAQMADAGSRQDLDADRHFARVEAEYGRMEGLAAAGVVIAAALPLLTLAEVGRGRRRRLAALAGAAVFVLGIIAAVMAWL